MKYAIGGVVSLILSIVMMQMIICHRAVRSESTILNARFKLSLERDLELLEMHRKHQQEISSLRFKTIWLQAQVDAMKEECPHLKKAREPRAPEIEPGPDDQLVTQ